MSSIIQPKPAVKIVLGAMTIGNGAEQSRISDIGEAAKLLDTFQSHGHNEIDTSRIYGGGSSEEYLAKMGWQERGLVMDTKVYPSAGKGFPGDQFTLRPEHLRESLHRSLKALNAKKIDMWYLHAPERNTPIIDTLREVNNLYKEGLFDRFAISNYMAWEVAEICDICEAHGWVRPSVYQGIYNALNRTIEPELLSCLRRYSMGFYAYNPLGGGFFTGNFSRDAQIEKGSRFDPEKLFGRMYRARYFRDEYFEAMDMIRPLADRHGLTLAEVALRWMTHHSQLGTTYNDAILIGASSSKHLEQNLVDLEKPGLPQDVLEALDASWEKIRHLVWQYWH